MAVRVNDWMGEDKYLGLSKALVIDNRDPDRKGKIRVQSPVFGESSWIPYIYPEDGFFSPPDIGSVVYVEADGGDSNFIVARGTVNDGPDTNPDTRIEFQRDIPTNRGWSTPGRLNSIGEAIDSHSGHILELDDGLAILEDGSIVQTAENRGIRLSTFGGHYLRMWEEAEEGEQKNRIELGTVGQQSIELVDDTDIKKQNITITDAEGRTIEIIKNTDRIRLRNSSGTIYIDIDFANDIIEIDANNVKIGSNAAEALVRGDTFRELFNAHRHVSAAPGVPTDVPVQQMDPSSANTHLSSKHTVE